MTRRPVLIDLDGQDMARPDTAPTVPDEAHRAGLAWALTNDKF